MQSFVLFGGIVWSSFSLSNVPCWDCLDTDLASQLHRLCQVVQTYVNIKLPCWDFCLFEQEQTCCFLNSTRGSKLSNYWSLRFTSSHEPEIGSGLSFVEAHSIAHSIIGSWSKTIGWFSLESKQYYLYDSSIILVEFLMKCKCLTFLP